MITNVKQIRKVLILGGGTMGYRIALQCAISGFQVRIYDIHKEARERAARAHCRIFKMLIKREPSVHKERMAIESRIQWRDDLSVACEGIDFVSESVTESLDLKKKVWKSASEYIPSHAILSTNTSYLLPSDFAEETGAPNRFCAFHFHDVFTANVVDIMPHKGTDPAIVAVLYDLAIRLNQIPVKIMTETKGYIFNKLFANSLFQATLMVANGISSIEDVDRSWMGNYKTKIGPFGMMDEVGIDTVWHVNQTMNVPGRKDVLDFLSTYIKNRQLGIKTGVGFYNYPNPEYKDPKFLRQLM